MTASPFAFLRGSPAMMACDLSTTPATGIRVQACGDTHISNFGIFGSPERRLVFDVNDFDETLPAPWEWDLKRLAASTVVAGRENGMRDDDARDMAVAVAATYRTVSGELAKLAVLDIWNASIDVDRIAQLLDAPRRKGLEKSAAKARRRTSMQALKKLTVVDGQILMQAASDPFLGHVSANRRDFYVRQLRDMKGSADVSRLAPEGFLAYVEVCATALARAHARTCHPAITSGYMGSSERFDCAIGDFAVAYADQNEADYEAFLAAVRSGRIDAETEV